MTMILWIKEMMADEYGQILIWLIFILMMMAVDILTGFIQACVNHKLKSRKMSDGILKKAGVFAVLVVIVPFTFVLPNVISTSVIVAVYAWETGNELISISENLDKMGVDIKILKPITKRLNNDSKGDDDNAQ